MLLSGKSVNNDQSLETINTTAPWIISFELKCHNFCNVRVMVVIEKTNTLHVPSVSSELTFALRPIMFLTFHYLLSIS